MTLPIARFRRLRKSGKSLGGLAGLLVLVAMLAAPAGAYPRPGITERVSVASDGAEANADSVYLAVNGDGRYVAFSTEGSTLVPGDTNDAQDVFVHDRDTGATERVSVTSDGAEADSGSTWSAISADGRYVAFRSTATNLVPGDTNGAWDVFVHDRATGVTERVSVASDGAQADADYLGYEPAFSADGRYVAFESYASNLVVGDTNGAADLFVHDRATGVTERVSVATDGTQADSDSFVPALSADGRYVTFSSMASNLVAGDTNGWFDVFVHDRFAGTTERVSVATGGAQADLDSAFSDISANGRYVAFESQASGLVPGDTNETWDVFLHDRTTGATERVSVASDGTEANSIASYEPSISADGRHVAFTSYASNLVPGDANEAADVFVHDRATGATERVSVASDGTEAISDFVEGQSASAYSAISADGRRIAFLSKASNLVPGDANDVYDVFLRDRGEPPPVSITYRGSTSEVRGRSVTLSARLFSEEGLPVGDRLLRFSVGEFEAEATTDENGDATVDMPVDQPYGSHEVAVSFSGDEVLVPAETTAPFTVLWEHEFADEGRVIRVNTILGELQFEAPGDVGKVKTDPDMSVEPLPNGDTLISIEYTDDELTVVGRFVPERQTFVATVSAPSGAHVLRSEP